MEKIISEEQSDNLMRLPGEVTSVSLKNDLDFVLREEGEEGLKRLEKAMANEGFPIKHKELKSGKVYPFRMAIALIIVIQRLFNYDNDKLREMGRVEARISSFLIRVFMRHFISLERVAKEVPTMWKEHYNVGQPRVMELNKEKKYVVLRIEDFHSHPFICQVHQGYFPAMVEMVVGTKVSCQETKCIFRGDPYHEFLLKW